MKARESCEEGYTGSDDVERRVAQTKSRRWKEGIRPLIVTDGERIFLDE